MIYLGAANAAIILFLAGMHFYWALGGKWQLEAALPTNEDGRRILHPGPIDSIVVGSALLVFAGFQVIGLKLLSVELPEWLNEISPLVVGTIFLLRAIGDFTYVGFFKKVKETTFGRNDTRIYSPLCLVIGVIAFLVEWLV